MDRRRGTVGGDREWIMRKAEKLRKDFVHEIKHGLSRMSSRQLIEIANGLLVRNLALEAENLELRMEPHIEAEKAHEAREELENALASYSRLQAAYLDLESGGLRATVYRTERDAWKAQALQLQAKLDRMEADKRESK